MNDDLRKMAPWLAGILADVQARGDAAVLEYTRRFDALPASSLADLELPPADLAAAFESLPARQREALQAAIPQAQVTNFPGSGHLIHAEQEDAFVEAVGAFLRG